MSVKEVDSFPTDLADVAGSRSAGGVVTPNMPPMDPVPPLVEPPPAPRGDPPQAPPPPPPIDQPLPTQV